MKYYIYITNEGLLLTIKNIMYNINITKDEVLKAQKMKELYAMTVVNERTIIDIATNEEN